MYVPERDYSFEELRDLMHGHGYVGPERRMREALRELVAAMEQAGLAAPLNLADLARPVAVRLHLAIVEARLVAREVT